jgi:UDP-N-acetylmuramate dehydrogenase
VRIQENIPLAPLTTLGIGGPARWFVDAESETDVAEVARWTMEKGAPLFVLGAGSNLLVSDAGFDGLVLRVCSKGVNRKQAAEPACRLYEVAAGEDWDEFVQQTVEENCAGLECLAGIPGTVGGTPVQNVGAYGQEVSSSISAVRAFDLQQNRFVCLSDEQCEFGYRRSRFNSSDRGRYVVTSVEYKLTSDGQACLNYADVQRAFASDREPTLRDVADAVRNIRRAKGMVIEEGDPDCRSAGSFFKNPIATEQQWEYVARISGAEPPRFAAGANHPGCAKLSAAWLIERAGFSKGYTAGRAAISTKHTLALVNLGGASAAEIIALADHIRSSVSVRFSIELQMEPVMLGF